MAKIANRPGKASVAVQVGNYYTDGRALLRVESLDGDYCYVENCVTERMRRRSLAVVARLKRVVPDASA